MERLVGNRERSILFLGRRELRCRTAQAGELHCLRRDLVDAHGRSPRSLNRRGDEDLIANFETGRQRSLDRDAIRLEFHCLAKRLSRMRSTVLARPRGRLARLPHQPG